MSYILAQGWANPKVAVTNLIHVRAYAPVGAPAHYANARVYGRARNNCVKKVGKILIFTYMACSRGMNFVSNYGNRDLRSPKTSTATLLDIATYLLSIVTDSSRVALVSANCAYLSAGAWDLSAES